MSDTNGFALESHDLDFFYGEVHALKQINLEIPEHQVTALIGPSGCGKSTLLRMVLGSEQPTSGSVLIDAIPAESCVPDLDHDQRGEPRNGMSPCDIGAIEVP